LNTVLPLARTNEEDHPSAGEVGAALAGIEAVLGIGMFRP
jgi:hypothetical protein